MAVSFLEEIFSSHRARAAEDERDWRQRESDVRYGGPSFSLMLRKGSSPYIKVIAEIKRRSPSRGVLVERLDVAEMAGLYRDAGASAVSVLTDENFFDGSLDDLEAVRRSVELPILRKDFTVSENDIFDARDAGAAAVLLIVSALSDAELTRFLGTTETCGLDALVEIHDAEELRRALAAGAGIIGVNQRNLETFDIDPRRGEDLIQLLPAECLCVCESGIRDVADVERIAQAGYDAVLVGEAFVMAEDPASTVKSFALVASTQRV